MSAAEREPEVGAEIVPFQQPRTLDLRDAATDSWTDVVEEVGTLASRIANTEFVPDALRGNGAAVAAAILSGREVGMAPMTALATINVIKGKPAVSAEAMRGLVLQAGHQIIVTESSSSRVIMKGRRKGFEEWSSVAWTLDDAKRAGLRGDNWSKYPRQMLTARATTELCRLIFADVIHGLRSVEEMQDAIDTVTESTPPPPARTTTVQRKRAAKKPAKAAPGEPKDEPPTESDNPPKDVPADVTPARKRVGLPAPKTSSPPNIGVSGEDNGGPEESNSTVPPSGPPSQPPAGDDPQQGKDEPDNDAEIVDAEIVTGRSSGPKISHGQRGAIIGHFKRLGVDDRDEYLLITNVLLQLEPGTIGSTNELRGDEPQRLLKILETLRDRDALDQLLNGQDQLT